MKIGGIAIGAVSILDEHSDYEAPVWFPYVKKGSMPLRAVDSATSLYDAGEGVWKDR